MNEVSPHPKAHVTGSESQASNDAKPAPARSVAAPIALVRNEEPVRKDTQNSIVPRGSVAGASLILVIAIMTFLASMTLGAVSLVRDTAAVWRGDIAREATIQIRPADGVNMEQAVDRVRRIAGSQAGVRSVTVLGRQAMTSLLQPWLGSGVDLDQLPVPRLITLDLSPDNPPDLVMLKRRISEAVPSASLDDHSAWLSRLGSMAQATILAGLLILSLVLAATVLTVVFATRGAMAGNSHVIEVLHFVGASPSFIAREFQRHFLVLGFKGALAGGVVAIVLFVGLRMWSRWGTTGPAQEQATVMFGTFSMSLWGYAGIAVLVLAVACLTALTSRLTVARSIGSLNAARPAE